MSDEGSRRVLLAAGYVRRSAAATMWLGLLAGCGAPVLSVDDALLRPDGNLHLAAYVEREPLTGLRQDVSGVRVRFFVDDREVGDDQTDDEGQARVESRPAAGVRRYTARTLVGGRELLAAGRVFAWDDERVIIAVDIDQTVERTEYKGLILEDEGDPSDPLKRSAETLRALAEDFAILYLTGRPRFLLDKTRDWLREHEFPDGPVITARSLRESLRPGAFKRNMLHDVRAEWPKLLIGIGDKASDADAYGANEMLTIVLARTDRGEYGPHALVFRDWKALASFFAANRAVLTSPAGVKDAADGKPVLLRPVPPYRR